MNIDKFTIDTQPFEKTLTFRLASPALDQSAAAALGEWNSPLIYGEFDKNNIYYDITGRVPLRQTLGHPLSCEEAVIYLFLWRCHFICPGKCRSP